MTSRIYKNVKLALHVASFPGGSFHYGTGRYPCVVICITVQVVVDKVLRCALNPFKMKVADAMICDLIALDTKVGKASLKSMLPSQNEVLACNFAYVEPYG